MINQKSVPVFVIRPKITPLLIVTKVNFIIPSVALIFFSPVLGGLIFGISIVFLIPIFIAILYLLINAYYENSVYELHKDYLVIKRNLIGTSESIIQYKNILDITKSQGPIQASFNLYNLIIRLAGDHHGCCLENIDNAQAVADFIYETKN